MKKSTFKQTALYEHFYLFGICVVALLAFSLAVYKFWSIPNGLSEMEIIAATKAGNLSLLGLVNNSASNLEYLVNLPWNLLEWLSIRLFGATIFAMRLPSVILMLASAGLLMAIFRKMTRANIAIISGIIAVTSAIFISLARTGASMSLTIFLLSLIILAAINVSQNENDNRKMIISGIILAISAGLLIYSPGGIYIIISLIVATLLHPKTRLILLNAKKWKLSALIFIGLIVLLPLIIGIISQIFSGNVTIIRELLAINDNWSIGNLRILGGALIGFGGDFAGNLITPVFSLIGLIVATLGLSRIFVDISSVRSYVIIALFAISLILSIFNPNFIYLLLIPFSLSVCVGFDFLVSFWYKLFPFNPYARILALTLIIVLTIGAGWSNSTRYFSGNNYSDKIVYKYNQEFSAVRNEISQMKNPVLIINPDQKNFYDILQRDFPDLKIETSAKNNMKNAIVANSSQAKMKKIPKKIVTNSLKNDSVLLRIY